MSLPATSRIASSRLELSTTEQTLSFHRQNFNPPLNHAVLFLIKQPLVWLIRSLSMFLSCRFVLPLQSFAPMLRPFRCIWYSLEMFLSVSTHGRSQYHPVGPQDKQRTSAGFSPNRRARVNGYYYSVSPYFFFFRISVDKSICSSSAASRSVRAAPTASLIISFSQLPSLSLSKYVKLPYLSSPEVIQI